MPATPSPMDGTASYAASDLKAAMSALDAYAVMAMTGDVPGRLRLVTASASARDSALANAQAHSSQPVEVAVERYVIGKAAAQVLPATLKSALMSLEPPVHVRGSWFEIGAAEMLAAMEEAALDCMVRVLTAERLLADAEAARRRDVMRVIGRR